MRTIKVSRKSKTVNSLLKKARLENLILRPAEGDEFIRAEVDDFNREIELARQNKQLMKLLGARARRKKTVPLDEARRQLGLKKLRLPNNGMQRAAKPAAADA